MSIEADERTVSAIDLWRARQGVTISSIRVVQIIREELDQAVTQVRAMQAEIAELVAALADMEAQRDQAVWERDSARVASS